VNLQERIVAGVLIGLVVLVALYFAARQLRMLLALEREENLASLDRGYLINQGRRRFFTSVLMLIFAGLLLGAFFLFPPEPTVEGVPEVPDEETKDAIRFFTGYWILTLCVLFMIVILAAIDLWATARYGFRNQQQLSQDRRAMLEEEAARLRRRRQELN
jgi:hypothetical protein